MTIRSDTGFGKGPDCFMPIVAVNNQGVVGVMWYDRRDNQKPDRGWWTRFAASFDGGESFQPSMKVSEAPNVVDPRKELMTSMIGNQFRGRLGAASGPLLGQIVVHGFNFVGGHTAGLAADANGIFHPLWVDDRTA